jgi:tetratricopeptide (TPR) repeat protein
MGEHDKATKYFEKAIEMEPDNCEWRNYIGGLYLEKRDYERAKVHLVESLRLNNQIFDTHLKLA